MPSQCRVAIIDFDAIIIVTEQVILVIGIHTPLQITERDFQLTDLLFNLVDHRWRRNWVGVIPSSFLAYMPKSGLFSRNKIFVILIREKLVRHMSTRGYLLGSWWWLLVSTPSSLASLATTASSPFASTSSGNFRDITDRVVHTLTLLDLVWKQAAHA